MAPINALPLLIEEPIRLASVLEHGHPTRPQASQCGCLTKIVGTVGGKSRTVDELVELLKAGMTAARFDFSSFDLEYHLETLGNLKQAMRKTRKLCAIIYDTAGPEVIIPNRSGEPVEVKEGSILVLRSPGSAMEMPEEALFPPATPSLMYLSVSGVAEAVKEGGEIFVGQYLFTGSESTSVWLKVKEVREDDIVCVSRNTGTLQGSFFTVHVSQVHIPVPTITEKDKEGVCEWLRRGGDCDVLSVSFSRSAECIREARALLKSQGANQAQVFAKIENLEGLTNFEGILKEANGVILGRGDLGIDLEPEKVFRFQKEAIQKCNFAGKPVMISRVVDTMTETPRPTRAEATDVANAVLDGVDAIMLGAETLRGLYPIETVLTVGRICGEAEKVFNQPHYLRLVSGSASELMSEMESIASSAVTTAEHVHASCIVVFTMSGETARLIAKYKPTMPCLLLVVPNLTTNQLTWSFTGEIQARQALVVRGLIPMLAEAPYMEGDILKPMSNESLLKSGVGEGKSLGIIKPRDRVVVVQKLKNYWVVRVVDA